MNPASARSLARELMDEHGLHDVIFAFDRSKSRFGRYSVVRSGAMYAKDVRTISLSEPLTRLNPESEVRDTILHEIAHALVGCRHGHDWVWKAKACEIGANPERCYDGATVVTPRALWQATCPHCHKVYKANRKLTRARACPCTRLLRSRDGFDAHTLIYINTRTREVLTFPSPYARIR